ncbi:MAG: tartrate dehydrogenase/decarboxylase / D-malate dehydrogenase [Gaiellales bacterium]|jgi:tartrate dehydrogenase/decarboxylase/D-malate dehydrogenase|nr:tartrate dehydrogenase/decarboxylase / D-malate dehydrogenase [Gaiellales bacterium]MDX6600444.1 tartrate dehydrogenase/decarboxylase / D-malate dehydrogenase [Gaiellales bacterium]
MKHRIAVLAGDGVGPEVVDEARRCVDELRLEIEWSDLDWGSDHWVAHGVMMPPDAVERLRAFDAILLGAVGRPDIPDHVTLWGLLLPIRQRLDLWANVRPVRLLEGVPCALAGRAPGDIDMVFVRENSEGEYSGVGGRAHQGHPGEVGIETAVFTRAGIERVVEHAFKLAGERRGVVTSATKSNASRYGYVLWDEVAADVAVRHPDIRYEHVLVDALAARMVLRPDTLDVIVASNLFGDILTDVGAAIQGGMGMAASANLCPGGDAPALFEPVHGSAPDIAGQGIANPCGAVWSAVLMLDHLGESAASARLFHALADVCREGPRTRDLGGSATTSEVGEAIRARLRAG